MGYVRIAILLNEQDHQRLHEMMAMAIVVDNKIKKRMFLGHYNQEWYRRVLIEGMDSLEEEFEEQKRQIVKKEKERVADEG